MRLYFVLTVVLLALFAEKSSAATKYWKGTISSDWTVGGNWSPMGVPSTGDDVIIDQNSLNTIISNVPTTRLHSLKVQTTGSAINCIFNTGTSAKTISFTGAADCLFVGSNCTLEFSQYISLELGDWGGQSCMRISGNCKVNGNLEFSWAAGNLLVENGGSLTVNGTVTYNSPNGIFRIKGTAYLGSPVTFPYSSAQLIVDTTGDFTVHGAMTYNSDQNIIINGVMLFENNFTVGYTTIQLRVGTTGQLTVAGTFLYRSDGNLIIDGNAVTGAFTIPNTASQIVIGTSGKLTINGAFSYNSNKDFLVSGNGTIHFNNSYTSGAVHHVTGTGLTLVDANKTMVMNTNLIIDHDMELHGSLVVPTGKNLQILGNLKLLTE